MTILIGLSTAQTMTLMPILALVLNLNPMTERTYDDWQDIRRKPVLQ
jgi:hypothetical protein